MEIKKTKNYHREHREINVLKKEKITENPEETKDFLSSVVKIPGVGLLGLCELCVFNGRWVVNKQNKDLCVLCGFLK